jgi:hypothetical protein
VPEGAEDGLPRASPTDEVVVVRRGTVLVDVGAGTVVVGGACAAVRAQGPGFGAGGKTRSKTDPGWTITLSRYVPRLFDTPTSLNFRFV